MQFVADFLEVVKSLDVKQVLQFVKSVALAANLQGNA